MSDQKEATQVAAIKASQLEKTVRVGETPLQILKGIDLEIHPGESLAIIGRSGSGKTTLLGLLAGLDDPTSGEIHLANHPMHLLSEDERAAVRAKHVGFMFQSFHLVGSMTALQNVMLPMELNGHADPEGQAKDYLVKLGLEDRLFHYPTQLSGGEQQRVALARAFACEPDILFADEPTGNLDSDTGAKIVDMMFELNAEQKTTLVLVTHDAVLADRCERSITIENGQLSEVAA